LTSQRIPFAIFTRNSRSFASATHEKHLIEPGALITRAAGPAKPDPYGLFEISKRWQLQPSEILFVGDYLYDLKAGLAAGMPTALYLTQAPDFDIDGAVFSFQNYSELQSWLS
jgi:phosphoglycolate phosphatase-like HAD superfamily hydrolase